MSPRLPRGAVLPLGLLLCTAPTACAPVLAERIALRPVDRRLVQEDSLEVLFSMRFTDPSNDTIVAFLRRPAAPPSAREGWPGIVLIAGRETGRRAAQVIPGPLPGYVLAVEYPEAIPAEPSTWGMLRRLPSIRRSASRMPGILVGAAEFLAAEPEVDGSRLALVGVSFGVPFAAPAGANPIFRGVALHHGGAGLRQLFATNLPVRGSLLRGLVSRLSAWYLRRLDPGRHVAAISPRPLLLINGLYDTMIPREAALRLAREARPPLRHIWLPHQHLMPGDTAVMRELADSTISHFDFLNGRGHPAPPRADQDAGPEPAGKP